MALLFERLRVSSINDTSSVPLQKEFRLQYLIQILMMMYFRFMFILKLLYCVVLYYY